MTKKKLKWAVIGGGNGGQALAGHLALMEFPVKLYDIIPDNLQVFSQQGGIYLKGVVEGFGKLELVTGKIDEVLKDSDVVVVVTPAFAHRDVASKCAPFLEDGQVVVLHPGSTLGALEFRQVLVDSGCEKKITLAETNSLIYACRSNKAGEVNVLGIKKSLLVSTIPQCEKERVKVLLNQAFPQIKLAENVLETSLENINAMMHPAPTLFNAGRIESGEDFLYYYDGVTPSIGGFIDKIDMERRAVGQALGLDLLPIGEWYKVLYGVEGSNLSEAVKKVEAYAGVKGQNRLDTRYLLEDVPMGLVPIASLGKQLGVNVEGIEALITLSQYLLGMDFHGVGRTMEKLGLSKLSKEELLSFVATGEY